MYQSNQTSNNFPEACGLGVATAPFGGSQEAQSSLDDIVRTGAQKMLQAALKAEVEQFLENNAHRRGEQGRRQVVRNGRLPVRNG